MEYLETYPVHGFKDEQSTSFALFLKSPPNLTRPKKAGWGTIVTR